MAFLDGNSLEYWLLVYLWEWSSQHTFLCCKLLDNRGLLTRLRAWLGTDRIRHVTGDVMESNSDYANVATFLKHTRSTGDQHERKSHGDAKCLPCVRNVVRRVYDRSFPEGG